MQVMRSAQERISLAYIVRLRFVRQTSNARKTVLDFRVVTLQIRAAVSQISHNVGCFFSNFSKTFIPRGFTQRAWLGDVVVVTEGGGGNVWVDDANKYDR